MPKPVIEFSKVNVINEKNLILSNVSLSVSEGDILYIVGRVGSGKSSIIKTIIGELPLSEGEARVLGFDLKNIKQSDIPKLRKSLGVVFQDFQLLADRSVMENLMFVLKCTKWSDTRKMQERCMEVLKMVGMESKEYKMPHQLSGGEQQRIAIARALLNSPSLILADEPTGNLDAYTASSIMNILMSIHNKYNTTIVLVTHNRNIIEQYPGRVLLCSNGACRELERAGSKLSAEAELIEDLPY